MSKTGEEHGQSIAMTPRPSRRFPAWMWVALAVLVALVIAVVVLDLANGIKGTTADTLLNGLVAIGTIGVVVIALAEIDTGREGVEEARESNETARKAIEVTRQSIQVSQEGVEAARESAKAAADAVKESAKGRLDATAPRVVVIPVGLEQQAYVRRRADRGEYFSGGELLNNVRYSEELREGSEFAMPRDGNQHVWFTAWGLVVNEGATTALVRMQGAVLTPFTSGQNPSPNYMRALDLAGTYEPLNPPVIGASFDPGYLLPPGKAIIFRWAQGRSVREWVHAFQDREDANPYGSIFLTVVVTDPRNRVEVIEYFHLEMGGLPLQPVENVDGAWQLRWTDDNGHSAIGLGQDLTQRWYRTVESATPPEPPYAERYRAYGEKHQGAEPP